MKVCRKCGQGKPRAEFSSHTQTADGLKSWCKGCCVASAKASAARNPEKVRAHKQGWKDRNPEKVRAQGRKDKQAYYLRSGLEHRARVRKYAAENRDKIRARYTSPRGRMLRRMGQQRRLMRIAGAEHTLTIMEWETVVLVFGGRCAYCPSPWAEIDHVVPVVRGGGLVLGNVVPACKPCNVAKNARPLEDFCLERGLDANAIKRRATLV